MERLRDLLVRIRSKGVGFRQTERKLKGLGKSLSSVKNLALGLAGAGGLSLVAKKLFDVGAAAVETESKFKTTFGEVSDRVDKVAQDLGRMAGLSRTAARDILATTGSMAQGLGATREVSADLSEQVLQLAGDFGSFNNIPTAETARAVQAAFTGEFDSLKRLGIALKQAEVDQRALQQTGKKSTKTLTQLERAQAALTLITERGGVAMGDLGRTMNSPANRAKRLGARLVDIRDTIAVGMLPALEEALPLLEKMADRMEALAQQTNIAAAALVDFLSRGQPGTQGLTEGIARSGILAQGFDLQGLQQRLNVEARDFERIRKEIEETQALIARPPAVVDAGLGGARSNVADLREKLAELRAEAQTSGNVMNFLSRQMALVGDSAGDTNQTVGGLGNTTESTGKKTKTASDVMAEMKTRLAQVKTLSGALGDAYDPINARMDIFRDTIKELTELGLPLMDGRLQEVVGRLNGTETALAAVSNQMKLMLGILNGSSDRGGASGGQTAKELTAVEEVALRIASGFADSIVDGVTSAGEAIKRFVSDSLKELGRLAARFAILKTFEFAFPGSRFVSALSGAFGFKGRAGGGRVFRGTPFTVGERGPEMFVPNVDGRIVPHAAAFGGAGGGDVVTHITLVGADDTVVDRFTHRQRRNERLDRVVLTTRSLGFVGGG